MNAKEQHPRQHHHIFGNDQHQKGENRTRWVVAITLVMMVIEIVAGMVFGSMALLADGWHMATHAAALGVTVFAYSYARKHATNPRYSFGTGNGGALGGFASAISLALVALAVTGESGKKRWRGGNSGCRGESKGRSRSRSYRSSATSSPTSATRWRSIRWKSANPS